MTHWDDDWLDVPYEDDEEYDGYDEEEEWTYQITELLTKSF